MRNYQIIVGGGWITAERKPESRNVLCSFNAENGDEAIPIAREKIDTIDREQSAHLLRLANENDGADRVIFTFPALSKVHLTPASSDYVTSGRFDRDNG